MLFGRDDELSRIDEALSDGRLITLTGIGGVGKTTLALAAAEASPLPTLLAELAPLSATDLSESIAGGLGYATYQELTEHLAGEGTVLVLDNCEHVLDGAADFVEALLADCPDLIVLATSRERLGIAGETVITVPPLTADGPESAAVAMFTHIAQRSGSGKLDAEAVERLVRRLDGLPLAIELAASRSAGIDPALMLENLEARLDLISRSRARGASRHRSLEAAFAWSYQLLDQSQRDAFALLGVLPARFDIALAAAATGTNRDDTIALVAGLAERSLLVHGPGTGGFSYQLLDTVRLFAREKAEALGRAEDARGRILGHLVSWADQWVARGMDVDGATLRSLDPVFRHLAWAIESALVTDDEASCHRLAAPLWWLEDVGHQGEGADLLERVMQRWPLGSGDPALAHKKARTAGIAASLHRIAGRLERAAGISREVVAADEEIGAAYAHRVLGHLARSAGKWELAFTHLHAGAAAAAEVGDPGLATEIRMHVAMTHARSGDIESAVTLLEELRTASLGHRQLHSWVSLFLGWLLVFDDPDRAEVIVDEVAGTAGSVEDHWSEASVKMERAAMILARGGDVRQAADLLASSLRLFHGIGNRTDIRLPFLLGAAVAAGVGDAVSAERLAATGMHHYTKAVLGQAEVEFLGGCGVPLDVAPSTPKLTAEEAAERLDRIGAGESEPIEMGLVGRFRRNGDVWDLGYRGREATVAHSKGMIDIAGLLARPGAEIAALDLMDSSVIEEGTPAGDAEARAAYKRRLRELREEIEHASALEDIGRAERARAEMDALVERLTADYGIGGRTRSAGATAEKARTAVTWRIRAAVKRIAASHPELGAHLDRSLRTGRYCSYHPESPVDWDL